MKVILLTDVPKVGNRYDVKDFKEGYAQNVLINRGLAELATPHALSLLEARKEKIKKQKDEENKIFNSLIASIDKTTIKIKAKANEKGHLFKAVKALDISHAIKEISGVSIDEGSIHLGVIKELGTYTITISQGDKKGECTVVVEIDK